nr:prepilin-type N-terminal cleavage/methylation domain-containing protein [Rhodoferax sp.]
MKTLNKQAGFTLVEIAIVLVIIGLLLTGILKGQEMIENARVTNMVKDINNMTAAVTSYKSRYRGLPGDDLTTTTHTTRGWGTVTFTAGDNNALIGAGGTAVIFPPAATTEGMQAIQALRYAGFIEGSPALLTLPQNAGDGFTAITNNVMGLGLRNVVCLNGLTGKQAGTLDRLLDDGVNSTGNFRATVATSTTTVAAPAAVENYAEATTGFMVCTPL